MKSADAAHRLTRQLPSGRDAPGRMPEHWPRLFSNVALLFGLFALGGLSGLGVHVWIGGLGTQRAQLERCILHTKHSHPSGDASTLAHLDVEVPACMNEAGYEEALDNEACSPALWRGDVFCYRPKSYLGQLVYRLEARMRVPAGER